MVTSSEHLTTLDSGAQMETQRAKQEQYLRENQFYCGHTPTLMKQLEPGSISLSFWSPPYFVGKEYERGATFESWQKLLELTIEAHQSALKCGGFLVINIADILAFRDASMPRIQAPNKSKRQYKITKDEILAIKKKHPDYNRHQIASLLGCSEQTIDRRLNGNNARGGKYKDQTRVLLVGHYLEKYAYENDLYLYDRRIWAKDPTWQNSQWHSNSYRAVSEYEDLYFFWKPGETVIDRDRLRASEWAEWGSRGIWHIPSVKSNTDHEAQFPLELARRVIRLLTEKNELVLDPFMGSGTTAVAAMQEGRDFIGFDKEIKYVEYARRKLQKERDELGYLWDT